VTSSRDASTSAGLSPAQLGAPAQRTESPGIARGARLAYLDNLKVVLVAGVIVAHAAMTYGAAGTWVFESGDVGGSTLASVTEILFSVLIGIGVMFAMGLFMLISGLLTPRAVARAGSRSFALSRLARLGLPIVIYVVLVMPLLGVLVAYTVGGRSGAIWPYYVSLLENLSTGPLWFIVILLAISLGYTAWRQLIPPRTPRSRDGFSDRDLAVAAGLIAAASFAVRILWPLDSGQYLDAHVWLWPQCAVLFGLGALTAERGLQNPTSARVRRHWATGSLVALVILTLVLGIAGSGDEHDVLGGFHWEALALAIFEGVFAIGMSLWVLGIFQRHCDHERRFTRPLSRSAYGAFILQAPVLVGIALALHEISIPADAKFILLAAGGVCTSFAAAWLLVIMFGKGTSSRPLQARRVG